MKTLYLLRHAKSSWDDPELKDFERPLAERGLRDIPKMAARFRQRGDTVGCVITSPALRAKTTAKLMADQIGFRQMRSSVTPSSTSPVPVCF